MLLVKGNNIKRYIVLLLLLTCFKEMGNTCNSKSYEYEHKQHCVDEKISLIHDGSSILSTSSCYNDIDQCYYIGTCSDDNRIAILKKDDSNRYTICHYLLGHEKAVNRIAMNKNLLWSASRDLSLKQWNINSNDKCLQTISKAHELNISAVVTSTDNRTIYSGSRDYSVKVWDSEKGLCKEQYKVPRNIVTSLEIGNEHMLYQGSEDLCVRVWDTRVPSTQPAVHITGFVYFPTSLSLHEDEHLLATGCKGFEGVGCEVKLWDLRNTSKVVTEYIGHTHDVTGCKFNKSNQYDSLMSVSKDGSLISWDYKNIRNDENYKTSNYNAMVKDDKYYTSLSLLSSDNSGVQMVISAFDGTLSFKTLINKSNKYEFIDL